MAAVDPTNKNIILSKILALEETLKCKICNFLLKDPVLIQKCGHSSCKLCFGRHHDSSCPVCKTPVSVRDSLPDKQLQELLLQLLGLKTLLEEGVKKQDPPPSSTPKPGKKRLSATPALAPIAPSREVRPGRGRGKGKSPATPALNKKNHKGETLLHRMVIKGDIERVRELIKEGAEINTLDHNGWTPLHEASNHGHHKLAKLLLEEGALPNVPSARDLVTPLHDALLNGYQIDMALLLASRGADVQCRTSFGYTALDLCRSDEDRKALTDACSTFIEGSTIPTTKSPAQKSSAVSPAASRTTTDCPSPVFLPSNLSNTQKEKLQKCTTLVKGEVAEEYRSEVSHVVTSCDADGNCTRTMKVLLGTLGGKWIMNYQWVETCMEYKQLVAEDPFEAQGTKNQPNTQGPHKARQNAEQKLPPLFSGLHFYLHGNFSSPTPSREDLRNLIHVGGGRILSREPRPSEEEKREVAYHATGTPLEHTPNIILYQDKPPRDTHLSEGGVCTTQAMWLVACISHFKLLPPQQTAVKEK